MHMVLCIGRYYFYVRKTVFGKLDEERWGKMRTLLPREVWDYSLTQFWMRNKRYSMLSKNPRIMQNGTGGQF